MNDQVDAPAAFPPGTHWTGAWVGPRVRLLTASIANRIPIYNRPARCYIDRAIVAPPSINMHSQIARGQMCVLHSGERLMLCKTRSDMGRKATNWNPLTPLWDHVHETGLCTHSKILQFSPCAQGVISK